MYTFGPLGKWKIILDAIKGKERDYTDGSINLALVSLGIPMILEMVMESLFAIVDIFFVSKISNEAVATVGITESILMILESIAIGIAMAATAMIARRVGEKNEKEAPIAAANAILLGIIISLTIGVGCFIYRGEILTVMGGSPELVEMGKNYTGIILGFNFILVLLFILNGIFRGAGNAAIAMRTLWLANGLNIVLDPLLIFGFSFIPALGLEGAAIATCIGRGCGVIYQFYYLFSDKGVVQILKKHIRFHWATMKKIINIGSGGAGQFLIATASWIFLVRIISDFGDDAVAGYTIGIRIIIFTILPSWGLSNAVATLVGQNLGAGKPERAEKTVWKAGFYNMLFMVSISIIFFLFARFMVGLFIDDLIVIEYGVSTLQILCVGYIFFSYQMVISQAFNGAGDTRTPTILNFLCLWLIQIPLAYYLAKNAGMGPEGVFWAITLAESLLAMLAISLFRRGKWKTIKV